MGSAAPLPTANTTNNVPDSDAGPPTNGFHYNGQPSSVDRSNERQTILHLGDPIRHNPLIHERLREQFNIIHVSGKDLNRPAFIDHLKARTWGNFSAIMRPFWRSGNEMSPWDRELIELLPSSVKVMASAGAGFDWVDDRCLAENGIIYCNGAHASNESVADMALYHIISVFRRMSASSLAARSGNDEQWWDAHRYLPAQSHNPRGHTLGIVGLGNIGFAIAVKVKAAFGMKIIYHDVIRKSYDQEDNINAQFYDKLDNMLPHCDCLLIATPGGPPILTRQTLSLLRRGSRVVNIARGSLVDEEALIEALDSGHIDAAGLDVFAKEPHVDARLRAMNNVEMTCHTGGGSVETNIGFERLSMENCEAVLKGMKPTTPTNIQWLRPRPAQPQLPPQQQLNHIDSSGLDGAGGGQNHDRQSNSEREEAQQHAVTTDPPPPTPPPTATPDVPAPAEPTTTRSTPTPHLPPVSTRALNNNSQDASPPIDSAVSMSMDIDTPHPVLPPLHSDQHQHQHQLQQAAPLLPPTTQTTPLLPPTSSG